MFKRDINPTKEQKIAEGHQYFTICVKTTEVFVNILNKSGENIHPYKIRNVV